MLEDLVTVAKYHYIEYIEQVLSDLVTIAKCHYIE